MADTNTFNCANGHSFDAVAKLRARCPECGVMTRRAFGETANTPAVDVSEATPKQSEYEEGPVIVKQGKPRSKPRVIPKAKPTPPVVFRRAVKTTPSVNTLPKRTSPSKVAKAVSKEDKPFWHKVAEEYGF